MALVARSIDRRSWDAHLLMEAFGCAPDNGCPFGLVQRQGVRQSEKRIGNSGMMSQLEKRRHALLEQGVGAPVVALVAHHERKLSLGTSRGARIGQLLVNRRARSVQFASGPEITAVSRDQRQVDERGRRAPLVAELAPECQALFMKGARSREFAQVSDRNAQIAEHVRGSAPVAQVTINREALVIE